MAVNSKQVRLMTSCDLDRGSRPTKYHWPHRVLPLCMYKDDGHAIRILLRTWMRGSWSCTPGNQRASSSSNLHFGKGGPDAVRMATLLGIPLSADWGHNTLPHVARYYRKNAETLALHACDINLATKEKMAIEAGVKVEPVGGSGQRSKELHT